MINIIKNPDGFHYIGKTCEYFEGWYFKLVDKNGENPIAFIPGILYNKSSSHSFIQVFIGNEIKFFYMKYDIKDFKAKEESLWLRIRDNNFSSNSISLNLSGEDSKNGKIYIKGDVKFTNSIPWPEMEKGMGSMGLFNNIKFMECYSQVCSLYSKLQGIIKINEKEVDYTGGTGFVEKNWGRNFPKDYFWVQASSFKEKRAAVTLSYGRIPLYLMKFNGFIGALYIKDRIFTFTTMNKSRIKLDYNNNGFYIELINKKYLMNINVYASSDSYYPLMGPYKKKMVPKFKESLKGLVEVKLYSSDNRKLIFEDYSNSSGVEFGGNLDNLK